MRPCVNAMTKFSSSAIDTLAEIDDRVRKPPGGSPEGFTLSESRQPRSSPSVRSSMEAYLHDIDETALLSAEEEKQLAHRIEEGDSEARDHMVRANLRLVVKIARGYSGKGLSL